MYVADRSNRRIQVFDSEGTYLRSITMVAPYDKKRHPTLGNTPANLPDEAQAWTICITDTPTQYLLIRRTKIRAGFTRWGSTARC